MLTPLHDRRPAHRRIKRRHILALKVHKARSLLCHLRLTRSSGRHLALLIDLEGLNEPRPTPRLTSSAALNTRQPRPSRSRPTMPGDKQHAAQGGQRPAERPADRLLLPGASGDTQHPVRLQQQCMQPQSPELLQRINRGAAGPPVTPNTPLVPPLNSLQDRAIGQQQLQQAQEAAPQLPRRRRSLLEAEKLLQHYHTQQQQPHVEPHAEPPAAPGQQQDIQRVQAQQQLQQQQQQQQQQLQLQQHEQQQAEQLEARQAQQLGNVASGQGQEQLLQLFGQLAIRQQPPAAEAPADQQQQPVVVIQEQEPDVPTAAVVVAAMTPPGSVTCSRPCSLRSAAGASWAELSAYLAGFRPGQQQVLSSMMWGPTRLEVLRPDFARLQPTEWLNDEIVNFYLVMVQARTNAIMQQQQELRAALEQQQQAGALPSPLQRLLAVPRSHIFSSFFYELLAHGSTRRYSYASVRRWTLPKRTRTPECVLTRDLLLFPINLHNTHWAVAAVWPQRGLLQYYDSNNSSGATILAHLARWLADDASDKGVALPGGVGPGRQLARDNMRAGMPQQADGSSCGLFAVAVCERLAAGWAVPFDFSQADIPSLRLGMAVDILRARVS